MQERGEATRCMRVLRIGSTEHRMEAVFDAVTEGGRSGQGRYLIDGVRVSPDDFDRVLRLATATTS